MEQISSESRTPLSNLLGIVGGTRKSTMSTKESGTLCSRQNHFINVLEDTKLGKNVALRGFSLNIRQNIRACYTVHLAGGQTLLCKTIASVTIKRYLSAAAELSGPANILNLCLDIMVICQDISMTFLRN